MLPNPIIPVGLCQCGCGEPTLIADRTRPRFGIVKGEPRRFLAGHNNRLKISTPRTTALRFWSKVDKSGPCWLWTGLIMSNGYGVFRTKRKRYFAHRAAYTFTYGDIPDGLFICHHCDVRACCRPDHLFTGTHQDNMDDMWAKGRGRVGADAYGSKLTDTDVLAIYHLLATTPLTHPEIAGMYGVARSLIGQIANGNIWKHLGLIPLPHRSTTPLNPARGERQGGSKLTTEQVLAIRARYGHGGRVGELAREYGVSWGNVSMIVARKTWRHV